MKNNDALLLTTDQAAKRLQISRPKIFELCHTTGFPVIRIGRAIRIPANALENWINKQMQLEK